MVGRKTLSVSLEADKSYIQALRMLAAKRGVTVGKMVRDAVDSALSEDLKPLGIFFANSGIQINHSADSNTSSGPGAA